MAEFTMPLPTLYTYIRDLEIIAGRALACRNFTAAIRAKEAIAQAMGFRVPKESPQRTMNELEATYRKAHPKMFCDKHREFGERMGFLSGAETKEDSATETHAPPASEPVTQTTYAESPPATEEAKEEESSPVLDVNSVADTCGDQDKLEETSQNSEKTGKEQETSPTVWSCPSPPSSPLPPNPLPEIRKVPKHPPSRSPLIGIIDPIAGVIYPPKSSEYRDSS